jgi:hypothetical protein
MGLEQAMDREAVQAGLLDRDHRDRITGALLDLRLEIHQEAEQPVPVTTGDDMLGQLAGTRQEHDDQPL